MKIIKLQISQMMKKDSSLLFPNSLLPENLNDNKILSLLYDYTAEIKQEYLRSAPPLHKVRYDARLDTAQHALGLHTAISRVQGGKL